MDTVEQAREVSLRLKRAPLQNGSNFHSEVADTIDALLAELEIANALVKARLSNSAAATQQEPVFLVATGVVVEGQETYTRHEGAPPPLSDFETLYAAPVQAQEQRKVLEQALEALNDITSEISMKRFWREKDEKRFDEIAEEAITAIQGVLK